MTKLNLHIAHQVPGRVRMKIPSAKGNPELLKQISETFAVIPGIERITVNPTTGSEKTQAGKGVWGSRGDGSRACAVRIR